MLQTNDDDKRVHIHSEWIYIFQKTTTPLVTENAFILQFEAKVSPAGV
jgi:hypothetical protein